MLLKEMSINDEKLGLKIERPVFNEAKLRSKFKFVEPEKKRFIDVVKSRVKKTFKPSKACFLETLINKLPIIDLFRTYKLKYAFKDFLSGLTVGIIQIAPTMANAKTANLPPINGLYVAFFSVVAYLFFGTSKHLSLGTHGVISIMVGNCIKSYEGILYSNDPDKIVKNGTVNPAFISDNPEEAKILIAMTLAIFAGLLQLVLGLINGGVISKYMCDSLIESLTVGSSYLIVVSQIDALLGIKIVRIKLPFKLIDNIIGIFAAITKINWVTVIISVISIVIIYCVKRFINEKFKKKLVAPIPVELIVVIVATIMTKYLNFNDKYGVSIVGSIPLGIPSPSIPPIKIFTMVFVQSLSIALVGFALNVSTAKYYAKKCNYNININQELIAYGSGNILSGLFKGMPATGGLTRTRIVETSGGKTQMYSLVSSILVLVVILGLGFLFRDLPNCVLAAIIFTALIHNCFEVKKLWKLYKKSKSEAIIWFSTFAGVMILDIDYGLYIGIAVSFLVVIIRSQIAPVVILGNIPNTDFYEDIYKCTDAKQIEEIRIVRYEDSIYYANADSFIHKVFKKLDVQTEKILKELEVLKAAKSRNKKMPLKLPKLLMKLRQRRRSIIEPEASPTLLKIDLDKTISKLDDLLGKIGFKYLILDCSCINVIDLMGANAILQMNETCTKLGIKLHLTHLKHTVFESMNRFNEKKFDPNFIYPSNHDAVLSILDAYLVNNLDEFDDDNEDEETELSSDVSTDVSQISRIQEDLFDNPA